MHEACETLTMSQWIQAKAAVKNDWEQCVEIRRNGFAVSSCSRTINGDESREEELLVLRIGIGSDRHGFRANRGDMRARTESNRNQQACNSVHLVLRSVS